MKRKGTGTQVRGLEKLGNTGTLETQDDEISNSKYEQIHGKQVANKVKNLTLEKRKAGLCINAYKRRCRCVTKQGEITSS